MRLTCPNCDAQYEVPDEVIPTSGRDVQCSNCGQTWFQHHPDHVPADDPEELAYEAPAPDEEIAPPPVPQPVVREPERRQLDPTVADILRQEAEAEFEARKRRQSETLESQPDLGLSEAASSSQQDDAQQRAAEAKKRMARMRGEPDQDPVEAGAASRRELLPDIEEINSTLRNGASASAKTPENRQGVGAGGGQKARRGGFWVGFIMVALIAAILAGVYLYAPLIAQTVPQADPILNSFVTWIDQARIDLDAQIKNLLTWLDAMATQSAS